MAICPRFNDQKSKYEKTKSNQMATEAPRELIYAGKKTKSIVQAKMKFLRFISSLANKQTNKQTTMAFAASLALVKNHKPSQVPGSPIPAYPYM